MYWSTDPPVLASQDGPLHEMNGLNSTADTQCVIGMCHVKGLDAFDRLLHRVCGARGRHCGSIQLVWCTDPPVLASQDGPLHEMNGLNSIADTQCVIGLCHVKGLDAFDWLLHRVCGARGRHYASIQLVWCTDPLSALYTTGLWGPFYDHAAFLISFILCM